MNLKIIKTDVGVVLPLAVLWLGGCAAPPPTPSPPPKPMPESAPAEILRTRFEELHIEVVDRLDAGMSAVIGSAESQNSDLARNQALADGRKRLARMFESKVDLLRRRAAEEAGRPDDDPVFEQLNTIAQAVIRQKIQSLEPVRQAEETINGTVRIYCLMELDPQVLIDRIAERKELCELLQSTQAFILLFRNTGPDEAEQGES
jgi:hypothetical protein